MKRLRRRARSGKRKKAEKWKDDEVVVTSGREALDKDVDTCVVDTEESSLLVSLACQHPVQLLQPAHLD